MLAIICISAFSTYSHALKGWTKTTNYPGGGSRVNCDPDMTKTCTSSQKNPNGTTTILIYNYDKDGNLTGTTTMITTADNPGQEDPANGYIHAVETDYGVLYGKEINP